VKKIKFEAGEKVWQSYPQIVSVWLFGSAQDGELKEGADLDLALLFDTRPTLDELASIRADLQESLQIDDIDLTSLNEAGPILAFQAISGRLVFCRDLDKKVDFVSLAAREYEDAMALLEWGMRVR
jgi:predicted nucleotidyltransferase